MDIDSHTHSIIQLKKKKPHPKKPVQG